MDDIHYLIQQQENRKLEFKEKLPAMEKIAITAVAFSNAISSSVPPSVIFIEKTVGSIPC